MSINSSRSVSLPRHGLWVVALLIGLLLGTTGRAADTDDRGVLFTTVSVPAGLSAADVSNAAEATLLGRQWGVKSKTDSVVVGYLKHRHNEATVTMVCDTAKVEIYCVGYKIDKAGNREHPEQPKGWLKNLQNDLLKNLNRTITHK